jgi:hypothetical protein
MNITNYVVTAFKYEIIIDIYSSSYCYSTGFYNPLAGFSLLILEVSSSHTMTQHSR